MISTNSYVTDIFKKNTTVQTTLGCYIEYNMNSMCELTESSISAPAQNYINGRDVFKKLFPIDSIIKPFRPLSAGIKYAIAGDVAQQSYVSPKAGIYPLDYRTYYPGVDTAYKYWIANKGAGATITISYPKTVVTNKIVAKFEISHSVPPTWSIYATIAGGSETLLLSGTNSDIPGFVQGQYNAGQLNIYYTGSGWSKNAADHDMSSQISITSLKLVFGGVTNKYVGVVELSPRWCKDVSSRIVDINISKESSYNQDSILPVGFVSANAMTISLNGYDDNIEDPSLQIVNYDKSSSYAIDTSKIYLYKKAELNPYINVYHSDGSYGSGSNKYDKVFQGKFYMDSWQNSEWNEVTINNLDGAKVLQETIAPSILCDKYSIIAIMRRLLDSIGFTNYNFNLTEDDQSIISPNYWWTDDSRTVWDSIQELCRDAQLTAVFDENNVLQFYTREYMYDSTKSAIWDFTYDKNEVSGLLPNIASLSKTDVPSANQITVRWMSAQTSQYDNTAAPLWRSDNSFLAAAALVSDLNDSDVSSYDSNGVVVENSKKYVTLAPFDYNEYLKEAIIYSYNGYLAIDNEVIEYDAIEYTYTDKDTGLPVQVDIMSDSDIAKYRYNADPTIQNNFRISGRYRIKSRGALDTDPGYHRAGTSDQVNSWTFNSASISSGISQTVNTNSIPVSQTSRQLFVTGEKSYLETVFSNYYQTNKNASTYNAETSKSLFRMSNTNKDTYAIANKEFSRISTTSGYWAYGTTMYMPSAIDQVNNAGGIGFFFDSAGLNGYLIRLDSSSNAGVEADNSLRILKVVDGEFTRISDSQNSQQKTLVGVYGGESYKIDLRVKLEGGKLTIDAYVNGFKVTAVDESPLSPTKRVALTCKTGTVFFDYIYGINIDLPTYSQENLFNVYEGHYPKLVTSLYYGNIAKGATSLKTTLVDGDIEEFGAVAREIRRVSIKYDNRPALPLYSSVGTNNLIEIVKSRLTSSGAELHVLNNSGLYVPLDDSRTSAFYVTGNYISKSGQIDYVDNSAGEYSTKEPVIFDSNWIQKSSDAAALATWIKKIWSKKQSILSMNIFGNPLLSVGDVITVKYPYHELDGTQKFVITNISHTYDVGLETSIQCRTL